MPALGPAPAPTPGSASTRPGRPRPRLRFLGPAMVFLGTLILAADLVFVLSFPAHNIPGWWPLSWKIASGPNGSVVSTKAGQSTIWIEVEHPGCTPSSGGNWLAPAAISYTPWSVTITMSMNELAANGPCSDPQFRPQSNRRLPEVGDYLMGVIIPVQLSEPLGGRLLFDGSSSLPAVRPYP